jgi:large subunit ribosomal protein L33
MAKKGSSVKVRLESEAGTGYRYYSQRSTRAEYKIKKKKYDPWAVRKDEKGNDIIGANGKPVRGMHVMFVEKKMPPSKKN